MNPFLGTVVSALDGGAALLVSGAVLLAIGVAALAISRLLEHADPEWANDGGRLTTHVEVFSYLAAIAGILAVVLLAAGAVALGVPVVVVGLVVVLVGAAVATMAVRRPRAEAMRRDDALQAHPDRPWSARDRARSGRGG